MKKCMFSNNDIRVENNPFQQIDDKMSEIFSRLSDMKNGRVFHKQSTTLSGYLHVVDNPSLPVNDLFSLHQKYPVLVRHANGVQDDDAAMDNRGATIRLLNPATPHQYHETQMDLLLTTGECFMINNAKDFADWTAASSSDRIQIVKQKPNIGKIAWSNFCEAQSFTSLYYYSKIAYLYQGKNGKPIFAKFRLIPEQRTLEEPAATETDLLPPDHIRRNAQDSRSKTFLHEDITVKLQYSTIKYVLQIQFHNVSKEADELEYDDALNCMNAWSSEESPWQDLAMLHLDRIVENHFIENLAFNIANSPESIKIPYANSIYSYASLAHLRALVYKNVSEQRKKPEQSSTDQVRKILIVGAGPSGLFAAYELTKSGHQVTVIERTDSVGGKARSMSYDGLEYNLGAHVCTSEYTEFKKLLDELNMDICLDSSPHYYDIQDRTVSLLTDKLNLFWQEFQRYVSMKQESSPYLNEAGFNQSAQILSISAKKWFEQLNIPTIKEFLGIIYTASGYGYLDNEEIPAIYFARFIESLGVDSPLSLNWTPKCGFSAVWEKLAAHLHDVRLSVDIKKIRRINNKVYVTTGELVECFDELIVACPYHSVLSVLDENYDEKSLFKNIRYQDYYTTICRVDNLPKEGFYFINKHCMDSSYLGHSVSFLHRYEQSNIYSFYSYGNSSIHQKDIEQFLRADIERMGGSLIEVLHQEKWVYFPHVNSDAIQNDFYEKMECLQGKNNTYYLGSIQNFEAIECNLKYATQLLNKHFLVAAESHATLSSLVNTGEHKPQDHLEISISHIQNVLAEKLELGTILPHQDTELFSLGLDSVKSVEIFQELSTHFEIDFEPSIFFDYPTIKALAEHVVDQRNLSSVL